MRASFERAELLRLLGPVNRVVENRNTIPILNNLLLTIRPSADGITDGTVSVTGTDLDIYVTATGKAKVADGGVVTVDAKRFEGVVRKLPAGAEVAVQSEGGDLIVKSGRSRFRLPTLPEGDFPSIMIGDFDATFNLDLAALFKPVTYAISDEETRYYLNGIYFHIAPNELRAVATDGHCLARYTIPLPPDAANMPGIIVPSKTVGLVPPGDVTVSVSATRVRIAQDGIEVLSKVVDGRYPDYERVIPSANDKVARVDRAEFSSACDRVSAVSIERTRAVKFGFASGCVALSIRSPDADGQDEVAADYNSEPVDIGFNPAYVMQTLASFTGQQVEIAMADSSTPAIFNDGGNLLSIIMPLRV